MVISRSGQEVELPKPCPKGEIAEAFRCSTTGTLVLPLNKGRTVVQLCCCMEGYLTLDSYTSVTPAA